MNTGMLRDLNLKAGDKVRYVGGRGDSIFTYPSRNDVNEVRVIGNVKCVCGIAIQKCTATWEVVSRANSSPVREVVKKEIVSGWHGKVAVGPDTTPKEVFLEMAGGPYTKQELLETIATLQTIADAMEHKGC